MGGESTREARAAQSAKEVERLEFAVDDAILVHGGDVREAIRSLLVAKAQLENQLASATPAINYGYAPGQYARVQI